MATEQSTDDCMPECDTDEQDFMDDWVQYTYETFGPNSPEYQEVKIK